MHKDKTKKTGGPQQHGPPLTKGLAQRRGAPGGPPRVFLFCGFICSPGYSIKLERVIKIKRRNIFNYFP